MCIRDSINAMDMNKEYGDGANPVILKSEFIMSLCEQLIGGNNLGAKQKSIICLLYTSSGGRKRRQYAENYKRRA